MGSHALEVFAYSFIKDNQVRAALDPVGAVVVEVSGEVVGGVLEAVGKLGEVVRLKPELDSRYWNLLGIATLGLDVGVVQPAGVILSGLNRLTPSGVDLL